jgi:hypothetical protein
MNLLVSNINTIYCSLIFAKCENIFTATEARFLSNAPTQNQPPDSRLPPNADSTRPRHGLVLRFYLPRVATVRYEFHNVSYRTNDALMHSTMTGSGYYTEVGSSWIVFLAPPISRLYTGLYYFPGHFVIVPFQYMFLPQIKTTFLGHAKEGLKLWFNLLQNEKG